MFSNIYSFVTSMFSPKEKTPDTVIPAFQPGGSGWLFALEVIRNDESQILRIPPELRNKEFYLEAANANGLIIEHINTEIIDETDDNWAAYSICRAAVKQNINAMYFVPASYMTDEFLIDVVRTGVATEYSKYGNKAILIIPKYLLNHNIVEEAVKVNGHILSLIKISLDPKFLTRKVCMEAVINAPEVLSEVPIEFVDREFADAMHNDIFS